jgi:colanic acid biosynthesis glycosyl transferase WcaI
MKRVPLVLNVQDVYPDSVVLTGVLRNRLAITASHWLVRFLYRTADKIVVLSQGMRDNLLAKGVPASRLEIIPNWADVDEIQPLPKENGFRDAHNLNGRFVVLFAGNLGVLSGLDVVLDAARQLQDQPQIQFLIVGRGNARAHLVQRAEELRLSNLRFLPTQPREILPEMLAAADLSLVTLDPRLSDSNVPSKTYAIMASGRPILAAISPENEVARLVREVECGIWVPPDRPDRIAQAILEAAQQPDRLEGYGRNGRAYIVAHNARPMLTRRYHDLLHEVAGV